MTSSEGRTPDFREPGSAPRWRVAVGAAVVAAVVLVGIVVAVSAITAGRQAVADVPAPVSSFTTPAPALSTPSPGRVFVHILGRVERPGLYEVASGSRAVDVVARAGGFRDDADQAALNLARTVADGEQIVVPKVGESASPVPPAGTSSSSAPSGMVDLNAADAATLETLSGVGPATSAAILAWRDEHGRFAAVEDLLDVPGIGEKKLEALRESVVAG